jgi:hypothetical protein
MNIELKVETPKLHPDEMNVTEAIQEVVRAIQIRARSLEEDLYQCEELINLCQVLQHAIQNMEIIKGTINTELNEINKLTASDAVPGSNNN